MVGKVEFNPRFDVCQYAHQAERSLRDGDLAAADNAFGKIGSYWEHLAQHRPDLPERCRRIAYRLMSAAMGTVSMGPEDLARLADEIDRLRDDVDRPAPL